MISGASSGGGNLDRPFGERPHRGDEVDLLEGLTTDERPVHLARDGDHRR